MRLDQALLLSSELTDVSPTPDIDLELLLCHLLQQPRSYLFTWPEYQLSDAECQQLTELLARRKAGEPVAHIIGQRGFWSFDLAVSSDTLIPRPDTELLVETALQLGLPVDARVADLGTGTGAIALALASEQPYWQLVASDIVTGAVALAERNRQRLGLNNVTLLQGSWFEPHQGGYDLVISNPPYIDEQDPHLAAGDLRFEPKTALVAAEKGLADIRCISEQARSYLQPGGWLLFEHGYEQAPAVRDLLQELGFTVVTTWRDLADHERVTGGRWLNKEEHYADR
ncbi:peptide chain release factor N(5)-glutamine methyltransferase [Pontibacter sp. JAM-7]|uniref:peptide chain release factor N(5)-glutamine methyltransferase n=1 Tax=Pontibacter sp. JAM-7 TaxID=3366581 RepID=UPI003AF42C4A